jgi:hypothetical protein
MKINEYVSSTFFHHFIEAGPIVEHLIHENSIFKQPIFDYFFAYFIFTCTQCMEIDIFVYSKHENTIFVPSRYNIRIF